MPIEPVKIPQNVHVEDRIVGPLTLRQTIIIVLGGGFSYALYASLSKTAGPLSLVTTVLVWIPCAVAVLFAIVKVNDLSLLRICLLMIERFHKPSVRTWAPRRGLSINIRTRNPSQAPTPQELRTREGQAKQQRAEHHIRELSSVLDRGLVTADEEDVVWDADADALPDERQDDSEMHAIDDDATDSDGSGRPQFPVDPNRIGVDRLDDDHDDEGGTSLSDLSAFRDIFPKS